MARERQQEVDHKPWCRDANSVLGLLSHGKRHERGAKWSMFYGTTTGNNGALSHYRKQSCLPAYGPLRSTLRSSTWLRECPQTDAWVAAEISDWTG